MKELFLLVAACLFYAAAYGQPPKKFNYQGIARNANGQPLANQVLGLRISIIDSFAGDPVRYSETHTVTTNAYGLYNVAVGGGTIVAKQMDSIDWANNNKYMHVEIDPAGGTSYTSLGVTQLLSVPYAMYAGSVAPGVVSVSGFSGAIQSSISGGSSNWVFAGPTTVVTATAMITRLTAAASGVLGLGSGTPYQTKVGMCYQPVAGAVTNFVGTAYTEFQLTTVQTLLSANATVTLSPGTYVVGFCVLNTGASAINNNDYVNGWVMVTQ